MNSDLEPEIIKRSKPEYGDTLMANIGANVGETGFVNTDKEFSIKNVALFKKISTYLK